MMTPGAGRGTRTVRRTVLLLAAGLIALTGCTSDRSASEARDDGASSAAAAATTTSAPKTTTTVRPPRAKPVVSANPSHDVFAFGARFHGSTERERLRASVVDIAATPSGRGYWLLGADGGVFTFGDARFFGSGTRAGGSYVGIAPTRSGRGYWLATRTGAVRSFGDASQARPRPTPRGQIVAIETTPSGRGFWLAASNGAVFGVGDAKPAPAPRLNEPVVGIAASGRGYLLAARDGGVFAMRGARFGGSAAADTLRAPIIDVASSPNGRGYWLVAADGGVFAFGAPFVGSAARVDLGRAPVVALAAHPKAEGYWLARGLRPPPPPVVRPPVVAPPVVQPRAPVSPPAVQPAPPPGPQPAPQPGPLPPPPPPPPPPTGGVLAIGDSVMLGAAGALRGAIGGINVDAVVSRQFGNLPGLLAGYRDRGALPGTIIVHLGTNGTVSDGDLDAAMQIAAGRRVVFVNVWVPRSWEGQSNAALAAGASRWANAGLADWRSIAAQPGMVAPDGYHMTGTGAAAYASMLRAAVG
jgi:hypothetical protein